MSENRFRQVVAADSGQVLVPRARWCASFGSKLRGFTFKRMLEPGEGLILVEARESRTATAIHMFFVFIDLAVIWVNDAGVVVDTALARPWRPAYVPQAPARFVIEAAPGTLEKVQVGDRLSFAPVD